MYPGNLHALVARDRHLSCNCASDFIFNNNDPGTPNEKLGRHRSRRSRRKSTKIEAAPSPSRRPCVDPSGRAFRLGRNRGRMMDCGIFKPSEDHLHTGCKKCISRGGDSESRVARTLYEKALSLRKMLFRSQALSLLDGTVSKPFGKEGVSHSAERSASHLPRDQRSSRAMASPEGIQSRKSYSQEKAEHLGIPVMPRNPFRDDMVLRSRDKELCFIHAASSWGVRTDGRGITARSTVGNLAGARAAAKQKCRFRHGDRWHEIAMFHRLLETGFNRRPARATLELIEQAMKETACESASPGCLSRAQFVSSLSGTLDPCDIAALHRIYSSFDPDGADNMQFVNFLACLVVTHKPETEAFLEGLQQTFLYNLGATSSEFHAEFTKGNRQVCWRFLRRLFKLYAQDRAGLTLQEIERLYQLCAASDEDFLQMSALFTGHLQVMQATRKCRKIITEGAFEAMFCVSFELLDLFNAHMTAVQAIVKRTLPSN